MTTTPLAASAGFDLPALEAFLASRQEPAWLTDQRRGYWQLAQSLPLPTRSDEEWRRTDLRLLRLDRFGPPGEPAAEPPADVGLLCRGLETAGSALSVNSHSVRSQLDEQWARQGVIFGGLDRLALEHPDLVRKHLLTRAVSPSYDKFAALHSAFWSGGALLYVPRGVAVTAPLYYQARLAGSSVDFSHILVVLEDGAEATLVTEFTGGQGPGLHCGAVELIGGPRSRLRFVNLQNWGPEVWHFAHQRGIVDAEAQLRWTIGALGSRFSKVNQHVELVGPRAETLVHGVMFTEGKQHLSYHTLQHHLAPNCHSDLLYKAALQDQSRTVWRGMIKVDRGAQKTDAYQRNDNLMLSDAARADSIPGLEIEADDVRCTHGSTTGRVDESQLFYACCRGLTRREAVRMIVAGFFQQVFDRIDLESVRDAMAESIAERVQDLS